jgi:hypothetical protein
MQHHSAKSRSLSSILAASILAVSISSTALGAASGACPSTGARIFITSAGVVSLNGKQIPASALKDALAGITPRPTLICYSRQNATGEPPPAMQVVLDAIISMKLPISFFTDGTFATPARP